MMQRASLVIVAIIITLSLSCRIIEIRKSSSAVKIPTATVRVVEVAPTRDATNTPEATSTPVPPTSTLTATQTQQPTSTIEATFTSSATDTPSIIKRSSGIVGPGEEGRIYVEGLDDIVVGVDKKSADELTKVLLRNDYYGLADLVAAGRVFIVRNNTRVLAIDIGLVKYTVRILEGKNAGRIAVLPAEWVVK